MKNGRIRRVGENKRQDVKPEYDSRYEKCILHVPMMQGIKKQDMVE